MNLNGNYVIQRSLGTASTITDLDTDAVLCSIRDGTNTTCKALYAAIVAGIRTSGGTLYDTTTKQYVVGEQGEIHQHAR